MVGLRGEASPTPESDPSCKTTFHELLTLTQQDGSVLCGPQMESTVVHHDTYDQALMPPPTPQTQWYCELVFNGFSFCSFLAHSSDLIHRIPPGDKGQAVKWPWHDFGTC